MFFFFLIIHNYLYYMPWFEASKGWLEKKVFKNFVKINNYLSPNRKVLTVFFFFLRQLPQDLAALTFVEYFRDRDKRLPFWPNIKMDVKIFFFFFMKFFRVGFCLHFNCFNAHENAQSTIIVVHLKRNNSPTACSRTFGTRLKYIIIL